MEWHRTGLLLVTSVVLCVGTAACDRQGPAGRAGEDLGRAIDRAGEEAGQALHRARERADQARERVRGTALPDQGTSSEGGNH